MSGNNISKIMAMREVKIWNDSHPIGQWVDLRMDDGTTRRTKTYAKAQVMCGVAVGWFIGIRGAYLLSRATPVNDTQTTEADFQASVAGG